MATPVSRRPLSDNEIRALCDQQITTASGWYSGELADERADALDLYLGEPLGDEVEGRSSVRTREVLDTIESIMPGLMRIFADAENIVTFDPVSAEDEEAAQQESDVTKHVFWKSSGKDIPRNRGFHNLYSFIKDGLLSKVGVLKVWWDPTEKREREEYDGIDTWQLAELFNDESVDLEVLEYELNDDGSHHLVVMATRENGRICIEPCPPEEFGVDRDARSIFPEDSSFIYHRVRKTKAELIEAGFDRDDVMVLPTSDDVETEERLARRHLDDEQEFYRSGEHWSMHRVWISECYIRVDRDGDGLAELLKVTLAGAESGYSSGSKLLDIEEVDRVPFVTWSPVLLTHKFYGLSIADLVGELQIIKTTLVRRMLDNVYQSTDGGFAINELVNLEDMLTSRPNRIARVKGDAPPSNSIMPMVQPPIPPQAFDMLAYLDEMRQNRTGVGDEVAQLDVGALSNLNTGVAAMAFDMARSRLELMARICAEIGLQPLFHRIHELLRKHQEQAMTVKLRNQWVDVRPQSWRERYDMTVHVGLGVVSRERRLMALDDVMTKQATVVEGGGMGLLVRPEHMQKAVNDYTRELGIDEGKYWVPPGELPPPPPPSPDYQMATLQIQQGAVEAQMQRNAVDAMKIEAEERIKQTELAVRQAETESKARIEALKAEVTMMRSQMDHADKTGKAALEAQIAAREQERKDAEMMLKQQQESAKRETDVYRSLLASGTTITTEQMKLTGGEQSGYVQELVEATTRAVAESLQAANAAQLAEANAAMESRVGEALAMLVEMQQARAAPTVFVRDDDGRVVSVGGRPVERDENGLVAGLG